ncbi:leucine-rich repeat and WD repeat-containing protein 1 isoform X2 [Antennarius striatus]|uniref:leucine-rich repeat and WD repeat-containing protein 1 isoform X2 n=1 Tax=Antennarius striatus TaxID=241820 RepID=UPI0035AEC37A
MCGIFTNSTLCLRIVDELVHNLRINNMIKGFCGVCRSTMEKITENILLEKGSPKTNKLEQIKTLNLSKLGLKLQDLPVKLLSRLQSLERLDLSGNCLQDLPKAMVMPALGFLDLSDNQMEDVTTLESLCSLEELKMENNPYITVSDNYKVMVLLPNLRIYNGKDVSTTANHLRYVYTENLRTRIAAVWEKSFSLPDPISAEEMTALEKNFIASARQQVKFGPSSVRDFTKWRVEILAKDYFSSLTEPKEELEHKESSSIKERRDVSAPSKRKRAASASASASSVSVTTRKKLRTDSSASPVKGDPQKPSVCLRPQMPTQDNTVRMSPRKTSQPLSTPTRGKRSAETTRRASAVLQTTEEVSSKVEEQRDANVKTHMETKPVHLKPLHVLQCHSKQDSSEDFSTQLWACAFQPPPDSNGVGGESRLVATCGGDSLCVIDCETGMVMKKYKVDGENFFALAWSTILMSRGSNAPAQPCSILAAGGKRGLVKLIHPRNNLAYGEFRASRKSLSVLRFNHQQRSFLFTGSYDNKIVMWDIGGVNPQYKYKVVQLLVLETSATPLHVCLPLTSPSSHVLTACEDGLQCYNTQLGNKNNTTKRSKEMEITFPIYKKEDKNHDYHTVDGLSFLTEDIVASKNYMHGSIYLWNWTQTKAKRPNKKTQSVCAVVLAELQWAKTDIPYLALNTCPNQAYIVCGDDKGRLWMYLINSLSSFQTETPIQPTEVLEWPTPVRKGVGEVEGPSINCVAMDPELNFLVALSDKNMVIVWKRESST